MRNARDGSDLSGLSAQGGFWRQLHNPVTSPYKVGGTEAVGVVNRVCGPGYLNEVEERRRERSRGA
jgi:hypothetical protein